MTPRTPPKPSPEFHRGHRRLLGLLLEEAFPWVNPRLHVTERFQSRNSPEPSPRSEFRLRLAPAADLEVRFRAGHAEANFIVDGNPGKKSETGEDEAELLGFAGMLAAAVRKLDAPWTAEKTFAVAEVAAPGGFSMAELIAEVADPDFHHFRHPKGTHVVFNHDKTSARFPKEVGPVLTRVWAHRARSWKFLTDELEICGCGPLSLSQVANLERHTALNPIPMHKLLAMAEAALPGGRNP